MLQNVFAKLYSAWFCTNMGESMFIYLLDKCFYMFSLVRIYKWLRYVRPSRTNSYILNHPGLKHTQIAQAREESGRWSRVLFESRGERFLSSVTGQVLRAIIVQLSAVKVDDATLSQWQAWRLPRHRFHVSESVPTSSTNCIVKLHINR